MPDYQSQLTPDAFVVYPSKGKLFLTALAGAAFVALGFGLWLQGSIKHRIVAVADWAFFGFVTSVAVARLVRRTPLLILNYSGIFDSSSAHGGCLLHWDEIASIYISSLGRQRFLSIAVKDVDGFLARQPSVRSKLMRANVGLVGAPVNISASTLPMKLEELLNIIRQKYPTARITSRAHSEGKD
jgi:hypothetical protein